jgi:hypothetical protein
VAAGLTAVLAGAGLVLWARPPERAYAPGGPAEDVTRELDRHLPADRPRAVFRDATQESGLTFRHFYGRRSTQLPEDMGSGAAWGDFDGDGHEDLFLVNVAGPLTLSTAERDISPAHNRLYRNNGNGTFADVTETSGLGARMVGMGAAWGDYDSDGSLDLAVTSHGGVHLYRNEGDGRFVEVTREAGLGRFEGFWAGLSWGDYDRDGRVDLYVCGYARYRYRAEDAAKSTLEYHAVSPFTLNPSSYPPERNLLLHNDGRGRFTEVGRRAGVDNPTGRSLSAAWADFDEDGWPDLYVANDVSDNAMFRNRGDGSFEDISNSAWVADYRGAMGLGVADWDGDGDQDIFITHWLAQENALYSNLRVAPRLPTAGGKLKFMDVADSVGLGQIALDYIGWGTFFFDYDNDGRPDLFAANGSTFQREDDPSKLVPMKDQLFWNAGDERGFFEVGALSGDAIATPRVGRGAAAADYDGDGNLDVVVVNHDAPAVLLRNEGGDGRHWLRVRARVKSGNRFGVGARVRVEAGGRTKSAQIGSQASYLSQNPYDAHFGLGPATVVDRVVVVFPDGTKVERAGVPADQVIDVWREDP